MGKRFSLICIIICALAVFAGYFYEPLQDEIYQYKSEPQVQSKEFTATLKKARSAIYESVSQPSDGLDD